MDFTSEEQKQDKDHLSELVIDIDKNSLSNSNYIMNILIYI